MIIAIKEKDRIVLGLSSESIFSGLCGKDCFDEENLPIRFTADGKLFAFAILSTASDMLLYDEKFIDKEISYKKIVTDIIPYMKKKFADNYYPLIEGDWRNALVICDNGHIYDINPTFNLSEISEFVCHGYSVEKMNSVLDLTAGLPAEERIIEAAKITGKASKVNIFPLVIVDTKTKKFKYVYEGEKVDECTDSI